MKLIVATLLVLATAAYALPSDRTIAKPVEFEGVLGFLNPRLPRGQTPLIVGGSNASPNQYPHQISLQVRSGSSWYHSCGGSVIANNRVVTAAHCIYGQSAGNLRVVAGDHDLTKNEGTEQTSNVASMVYHPSYNPNTIDYDFAVIRLSTPLTLNNYVKTIALSTNADPTGNGRNSGWGNTRGDGSVSNPAILQHVSIPFVARSTCASRYSGINSVTARMICAGAPSQGPCNGDSGGPLIDSAGALVGIVSWGMQPCAQSQYPGVYACVANQRSWILQQ